MKKIIACIFFTTIMSSNLYSTLLGSASKVQPKARRVPRDSFCHKAVRGYLRMVGFLGVGTLVAYVSGALTPTLVSSLTPVPNPDQGNFGTLSIACLERSFDCSGKCNGGKDLSCQMNCLGKGCKDEIRNNLGKKN